MSYEGMKCRIGVPTAAQYPSGEGIRREDKACAPNERSLALEMIEEIEVLTGELQNIITTMETRLSPILFPPQDQKQAEPSDPLQVYPIAIDKLRDHIFAMRSLIQQINSILDRLGI